MNLFLCNICEHVFMPFRDTVNSEIFSTIFAHMQNVTDIRCMLCNAYKLMQIRDREIWDTSHKTPRLCKSRIQGYRYIIHICIPCMHLSYGTCYTRHLDFVKIGFEVQIFYIHIQTLHAYIIASDNVKNIILFLHQTN